MSSNRDWQRVSRCRPCPVCGKPDWCLYAGPQDSPTAAICARVESPKRVREAGWLHVLRDEGTPRRPSRRAVRTVAPAIGAAGIDFGRMAERYRGILHPGALRTLADSLGLSVESLRRLGIGWSTAYSAWTFPMSDAHGQVVGIRLRRPDGHKLSVKGGHEGVFIPEGLASPHPDPLPKGEGIGGRLLVCEGPTDTAALLDLGLPAVGRPSCTGGVRHAVDLVRRLAVPEVVIVADADTPGRRGAENLASVLAAYSPAVRIIAPPPGVKDAREWKRRGARAADVQAAIDAAPVRRLAVQTKRKAGVGDGR